MVTPTAQTMLPKPQWLAWVIRANAAFCALCGLDLIVMASWLSPEMGVSPLMLQVAGVALMVYALFPWRVSAGLDRSWVLAVIALDVLWVVGSAVVLAIPTPMTMTASLIVEVVAVITALFGVLQYVGWRRLA